MIIPFSAMMQTTRTPSPSVTMPPLPSLTPSHVPPAPVFAHSLPHAYTCHATLPLQTSTPQTSRTGSLGLLAIKGFEPLQHGQQPWRRDSIGQILPEFDEKCHATVINSGQDCFANSGVLCQITNGLQQHAPHLVGGWISE